MVVADPLHDGRPGARAREVPRQPARTSTTSRSCRGCARRAAGSSTSPAGCPRRSPPTSSTRPTEAGLRGPRHPARPGPRLPGRATSPPTWSASSGTDEALAGFERTFDALLAGTDGSARYAVGGGNRIPLGESTVAEPVDGRTCAPRSTSTCSGTPSGCCARPSRTPGADSGFAVVMDTRTGELLALADHPTFDASDPLRRAKEDLGSRAMSDVYEPGSVEKVLTLARCIDAGKVTPRTRILVPPELRPRRPHHRRLVPPRRDPADPGRRARQVLQHRHRPRRRQVRPRRAAPLPHRASGSASAPTSASAARRRASCPTPSLWTGLVQDRIAFGQSLSVNAVQMAAAVNTIANGGVRVVAEPDPGHGHHRRRHRGRHRHRHHPPGGQRAGRPPDRADDGAGGRPRGGRRARRRRPRLPGRRQDRHRPAGRRGLRLLRRHASPSPSPASPPPTTRGSPSTSWSRTRATAAAAARSPARRSRRS